MRARKALQDLKTLAQELRVAIQRCKTESAHARMMEQNAQYVESQEAYDLNAPLHMIDTTTTASGAHSTSTHHVSHASHLPHGSV